MIDSVGLIGDPVDHSLSPAMQNAAFRHHGLPDSYVLWHTPEAELGQRVAILRAEGMRGANVTIPHKTAVVPLLDALDPVAEAVGAANTIVRLPDGRLHGSNTDVQGFQRALSAVGFDPTGKRVVVLGAGGAARAVVYGLLHAEAQSLALVTRSVEPAEALLSDCLATLDSDPSLLALPFDNPELRQVIVEADLLINATPVGLDGTGSPIADDLIHPHLLVVDLIYHATPFLRAAAQRGAATQDGLEMLVQQGALSFEAWTGLAAPVDAMRAAAQQALKERT
ncbi:MAG: shikimate dehydrogenase [Chloroflexi bacterium]|nr:shikimate dehydrogenase [Chloroflexota bacterium]